MSSSFRIHLNTENWKKNTETKNIFSDLHKKRKGLGESCVHYEQHLNIARDFTECHGVSLEGGLVLERVAAAIYLFSLVDRALEPDWRDFWERIVAMGSVHAKVKWISLWQPLTVCLFDHDLPVQP